MASFSVTAFLSAFFLFLTSSTSSSSSSIPSASILESSRVLSGAVDVIRKRVEAAEAESEAERVKELAAAIDAAFSAYFDLEMLIASKLKVAKEETPEVTPSAGAGDSPKYFDKVKQLLKSVVGEDKNKILPLKKLALGASTLMKEAVDLSAFDNALEGVMSRADAVFFILHDIEIRVNPNLEEYKNQLAAAYKKQATSVTTTTTTAVHSRRKRSYDHGYDSGWHIAHHLGFWQALADSNSASNHGDPVSKSHAIFWAINQNLGKARSPGWHHGFHDGHADGFDIGYHQGAAHAAIRQAAMELNGLGHLPLYGGHHHHVWKRSPYYGGYGGYGVHHHYGHAHYHSHLDHIMSHIHPDPHGYGPLHYHSHWW